MKNRSFALLGSLTLSCALALGACGSSSSTGGGAGQSGSLGGTTGSLGGTTGAAGGHMGAAGGHTGAAGGTTGAAGGSTGTGAGGASGACSDLPPCLTFIASCTPSGTCVTQSSGSVLTGSETINTCYSNGVKSVDTSTIDLTTGSFTGSVVYSKGGATCFTETFSDSGAGGAAGTATATIKNSAGATVATLTVNVTGNDTVTCASNGQSYVLSDNTCMPSMSGGTTSSCTDGVCQ